MDAQSAVRVGFGVVLRVELVLSKGLWIVLLRVCRDGCRVQTDEGSIHDAQLVELLHLLCHDAFQFPVVQFFEETVIRPVGWQGFHNVKPAVMGDKAVVVQVIRQICNLRKALTFHNNKRADHCFLRKAPPPSCRSGQREVQFREQLIVEHSGALGCEQCHVLNNFLPVDSGQPLSG